MEGQKADYQEIPVGIWYDRIKKLAPRVADFKWRNIVESSIEILRFRARKRCVKNITVSFGELQQSKGKLRERVGQWLKWDSRTKCYQWTGNDWEQYIKYLRHLQWKMKMKDYEASRDCVHRAILSNWWEWISVSMAQGICHASQRLTTTFPDW